MSCGRFTNAQRVRNVLADQLKAMQRVCFDLEPSETDLAALGSKERWLVYRDLVRSRLINLVGVAFARTKSVLGDEAFRRTIDDWLSTGGPETRYLRHIPRELFEFAIPRWRDQEPSWLSDLAQYEITNWDVRYAPPNRIPTGEFAFDRIPVLSPAVQVLRLSYPVHCVPIPPSGYEEEPSIVCVYRDKHHKSIPWKLNPIAASLIEAWARADKPVTETVHEVAAAHDTEIGPTFVEKLSAMIADALERGILLGGRADPQ